MWGEDTEWVGLISGGKNTEKKVPTNTQFKWHSLYYDLKTGTNWHQITIFIQM